MVRSDADRCGGKLISFLHHLPGRARQHPLEAHRRDEAGRPSAAVYDRLALHQQRISWRFCRRLTYDVMIRIQQPLRAAGGLSFPTDGSSVRSCAFFCIHDSGYRPRKHRLNAFDGSTLSWSDHRMQLDLAADFRVPCPVFSQQCS